MNNFTFTLAELGWRPVWLQQLSFEELEQCFPARVSAVYRDRIHVLSEQGELDIPVTGILDADEPEQRATVGDWLLLAMETHRPVKLLARQNLLQRIAAGTEPKAQLIAANIDTLFLVSSCNQDFNLSRLERYLSLAMSAHIPAVIVLTKADLAEDAEGYREQAQSIHSNVPVVVLNALDAKAADQLGSWLGKGQTIAFVGSSGVGKSTLTNALLGTAAQHTQDIREDDAKGRHTTTGRQMFALPGGGWVLDTPGMRELRLGEDAEGIAELFDDIEQLMGQCRFSNCHHQGDKGCAIEAAIASGELDLRRWQNYSKLSAEAALASKSREERKKAKQQWGKEVSKFARQHKKMKDDWR
ncbi:ribosome small subunit-dependent GTPase A [Reinekea marinisedimentorum]|uniref:Small ribosomal subunit biogenesis GTPase RsgA n=1 Tax=Reinekea marinisedimentorum TaxID=230495 RepID=A0A4R3I9N1_9GAMM|nr:ribosome small subunit-dependent GTPase A [Reinekea marinisedimentorum]TCS41015.1 ribosome biogenesis GTPase [Reinekea marinisedimentorum]